MLSGGTFKPPHISGPAFYCIFTVIGLCLAIKSVDLWQNLCAIILYFIVRVRCCLKESSRSLSHLLTSFLFLSVTFQSVIFQSCKFSYPSSTSRSSWRALISRRGGGVRPGGGRLVAGGGVAAAAAGSDGSQLTSRRSTTNPRASWCDISPGRHRLPGRIADPTRLGTPSLPACLPPLKLQILPDGRPRRSTETAWPCGFVGGTASRRRPLPAGVLVGNWTSSERNVISYVLASRGTGRATSWPGQSCDARLTRRPLPAVRCPFAFTRPSPFGRAHALRGCWSRPLHALRCSRELPSRESYATVSGRVACTARVEVGIESHPNLVYYGLKWLSACLRACRVWNQKRNQQTSKAYKQCKVFLEHEPNSNKPAISQPEPNRM